MKYRLRGDGVTIARALEIADTTRRIAEAL